VVSNPVSITKEPSKEPEIFNEDDMFGVATKLNEIAL
jgi:hypothetical protein